MSYPILFASTEADFDSNGLGALSSAIEATATEERNGQFELTMRYPVDGLHYADIQDRSIIFAKPNPVDEAQPFRIYRSTKPINGIVTFYARHISYDLLGIPVKPFTATGASDAMERLKANAVVNCPFDFWTDKKTVANMTVKVPTPIRSLLGGQAGSVLDVYGGEYKFDRYLVRLYNNRGLDRGVKIRYGKNLTDLEQERNCANVYTGVYPYWADTDGNIVELPEKIVNAPGTYDFVRIMTLDLSQEWREKPTEEQIRTRTNSYIKENNIGIPKVSITLSYVPLDQTEEYKDTAFSERIDLCDTVSVEFEKLGVSASAQCVKVVYNCLLDRYDSVTFGSARTNLVDTVDANNIENSNERLQNLDFLQASIERATKWITNGKGYMVAVKDGDGNWYEIVSLDKPDIDQAKNVWRWNNGGFGYSSNGYDGPYTTAITQDGHIVADFVDVGTLNLAKLILSGTLGGIKEGYGSTKDGQTTKGLLIWGPNGLDAYGNAIPPYILLTNAGFRVQTAEDANFNVSNRTGEMQGNFTVRGNIVADGSLRLKGTPLSVGDKTAVDWNADANLMTYGSDYRSYFAGRQAYLGGDYTGYETYLRGGNIYSSKTIQYNSDRTLKKDIEAMPAAYGRVLDRLEPVRYRYKTEPDDGPVHLGYIAQDVEAALAAEGIDDAALVGRYTDEVGNVRLALAYEELIPLLHLVLRKQDERIKDLEDRIANL